MNLRIVRSCAAVSAALLITSCGTGDALVPCLCKHHDVTIARVTPAKPILEDVQTLPLNCTGDACTTTIDIVTRWKHEVECERGDDDPCVGRVLVKTLRHQLRIVNAAGAQVPSVMPESGIARFVNNKWVWARKADGGIQDRSTLEVECGESDSRDVYIRTRVTLPSYDPLVHGAFTGGKQTLIVLGSYCGRSEIERKASAAFASGIDAGNSDFDDDGKTPNAGDRDDFGK